MPEIDPDAKQPIRFKDVCEECNKAFVYKGKGTLCFWCKFQENQSETLASVSNSHYIKPKSRRTKPK